MKITNYTLKEFLERPREEIEKTVMILGYLKGINTRVPVMNLTFREVESIKKKIGSTNDKDLIDVVCIVEGVDSYNVMKMGIIRFFGVVNSIRKQIEQIANAEERGLSSDIIDKKWEAVEGSKVMERYGVYNSLMKLSNNDPTKFSDLMEMEYAEIFTVLLYLKDVNELDIRMSKIKD